MTSFSSKLLQNHILECLKWKKYSDVVLCAWVGKIYLEHKFTTCEFSLSLCLPPVDLGSLCPKSLFFNTGLSAPENGVPSCLLGLQGFVCWQSMAQPSVSLGLDFLQVARLFPIPSYSILLMMGLNSRRYPSTQQRTQCHPLNVTGLLLICSKALSQLWPDEDPGVQLASF